MKDPFEKAKAIRKGELDSDMPMYAEITGWIQRVPKTWLPALLMHVIHRCVHEKVFQEGGIVRLAEKVIKDSEKPLGLRTHPAKGAKDE